MISRIKTIRKNAGVTQAEFAEALGLSRSMISQVEAGMQVFSDRSIRDICRIYGVDEIWLRTGSGDPYSPKTRNDLIAEFLNDVMSEEPASVRRRWVEAFAALPPAAWELFDQLAVEYVQKKEG